MTKQDKENLQNKILTKSLLIGCLATCEMIISKNAYLEKKWHDEIGAYGYKGTRLQWMEYREKIRSLLLTAYSMKQIIQMTKGCNDTSTKKAVVDVVELIDKCDFTLSP